MPQPTKEQVRAYAKTIEKQLNLPSGLVQTVIQIESSYKPSQTSSVGASGYMQVMPSNYKSLGITNPADWKQNIRGGALLLQQNLNAVGGNVGIALAKYNGGADGEAFARSGFDPVVGRAIANKRTAQGSYFDYRQVSDYVTKFGQTSPLYSGPSVTQSAPKAYSAYQRPLSEPLLNRNQQSVRSQFNQRSLETGLPQVYGQSFGEALKTGALDAVTLGNAPYFTGRPRELLDHQQAQGGLPALAGNLLGNIVVDVGVGSVAGGVAGAIGKVGMTALKATRLASITKQASRLDALGDAIGSTRLAQSLARNSASMAGGAVTEISQFGRMQTADIQRGDRTDYDLGALATAGVTGALGNAFGGLAGRSLASQFGKNALVGAGTNLLSDAGQLATDPLLNYDASDALTSVGTGALFGGFMSRPDVNTPIVARNNAPAVRGAMEMPLALRPPSDLQAPTKVSTELMAPTRPLPPPPTTPMLTGDVMGNMRGLPEFAPPPPSQLTGGRLGQTRLLPSENGLQGLPAPLRTPEGALTFGGSVDTFRTPDGAIMGKGGFEPYIAPKAQLEAKGADAPNSKTLVEPDNAVASNQTVSPDSKVTSDEAGVITADPPKQLDIATQVRNKIEVEAPTQKAKDMLDLLGYETQELTPRQRTARGVEGDKPYHEYRVGGKAQRVVVDEDEDFGSLINRLRKDKGFDFPQALQRRLRNQGKEENFLAYQPSPKAPDDAPATKTATAPKKGNSTKEIDVLEKVSDTKALDKAPSEKLKETPSSEKGRSNNAPADTDARVKQAYEKEMGLRTRGEVGELSYDLKDIESHAKAVNDTGKSLPYPPKSPVSSEKSVSIYKDIVKARENQTPLRVEYGANIKGVSRGELDLEVATSELDFLPKFESINKETGEVYIHGVSLKTQTDGGASLNKWVQLKLNDFLTKQKAISSRSKAKDYKTSYIASVKSSKLTREAFKDFVYDQSNAIKTKDGPEAVRQALKSVVTQVSKATPEQADSIVSMVKLTQKVNVLDLISTLGDTGASLRFLKGNPALAKPLMDALEHSGVKANGERLEKLRNFLDGKSEDMDKTLNALGC
jgi:hypothetical protein